MPRILGEANGQEERESRIVDSQAGSVVIAVV